MSDESRPFVSVIIPAFNNTERLRLCLAPLAGQTYPADLYEVIVVDNGSRDDLQSVVAAFRGFRLVVEPQPGSYAARNRGIAVARGEVLAFVDSDCIPIREWIERGVSALLASPRCGSVAGRVELFFRDPARPGAAELYDSIVMNFHQDRHVDAGWGGVGNLFTFRHVFDVVGTFNVALMSGGDLEWGRRAAALGYPHIYAADVCVAHPARDSMLETFRRAARVAGGRHMLKVQSGAPAVSFAIDLARAVTPALPFYARILGDRRLPRVWDRVRVVFVAVAVKYAVAWELLRLMLGGTPRRA